MDLTTLTDIELMAIQSEQQTIFQQTQQNLQVIAAEIAKRVDEHNKSKNSTPENKDQP